jgi:hypothetical protein
MHILISRMKHLLGEENVKPLKKRKGNDRNYSRKI